MKQTIYTMEHIVILSMPISCNKTLDDGRTGGNLTARGSMGSPNGAPVGFDTEREVSMTKILGIRSARRMNNYVSDYSQYGVSRKDLGALNKG